MLDAPIRPSGGLLVAQHRARAARKTRITIDPENNGGERGEVSIKGISGGHPMGSGPGGSVVARH